MITGIRVEMKKISIHTNNERIETPEKRIDGEAELAWWKVDKG